MRITNRRAVEFDLSGLSLLSVAIKHLERWGRLRCVGIRYGTEAGDFCSLGS